MEVGCAPAAHEDAPSILNLPPELLQAVVAQGGCLDLRTVCRSFANAVACGTRTVTLRPASSADPGAELRKALKTFPNADGLVFDLAGLAAGEDGDAIAHLRGLEEGRTLKALGLLNLQHSVPSAVSFPQHVVDNLHSLEVSDVSYRAAVDQGAFSVLSHSGEELVARGDAMVQLALELPQLRHVSLCCAAFSAESVARLAALTQLQSLSITGTMVCGSGGPGGAQAGANAVYRALLRCLPQLATLRLPMPVEGPHCVRRMWDSDSESEGEREEGAGEQGGAVQAPAAPPAAGWAAGAAAAVPAVLQAQQSARSRSASPAWTARPRASAAQDVDDDVSSSSSSMARSPGGLRRASPDGSSGSSLLPRGPSRLSRLALGPARSTAGDGSSGSAARVGPPHAAAALRHGSVDSVPEAPAPAASAPATQLHLAAPADTTTRSASLPPLPPFTAAGMPAPLLSRPPPAPGARPKRSRQAAGLPEDRANEPFAFPLTLEELTLPLCALNRPLFEALVEVYGEGEQRGPGRVGPPGGAAGSPGRAPGRGADARRVRLNDMYGSSSMDIDSTSSTSTSSSTGTFASDAPSASAGPAAPCDVPTAPARAAAAATPRGRLRALHVPTLAGYSHWDGSFLASASDFEALARLSQLRVLHLQLELQHLRPGRQGGSAAASQGAALRECFQQLLGLRNLTELRISEASQPVCFTARKPRACSSSSSLWPPAPRPGGSGPGRSAPSGPMLSEGSLGQLQQQWPQLRTLRFFSETVVRGPAGRLVVPRLADASLLPPPCSCCTSPHLLAARGSHMGSWQRSGHQ